MSYDLDAFPRIAAPPVPSALAEFARRFLPSLAVHVCTTGLASDGPGFVLAPITHGIRLSAGTQRSLCDERLMEICALGLAGPDGAVVDRHTGRRWPAALLREWLAVTGLLSGRALAANEARIARRGEQPTALLGFAERIAALTGHVTAGSGSASLEQRVREELGHYATRPAFVWPVARGLARLGDLSRIEALTRATLADGDPDPFAVAAEYGEAALPLFARALADADPNYRRTAARALHRVCVPGVLPLVAHALEDKRATVREAVLEEGFEVLIALPGGREALGPALGRLATDPSSVVRRLGARWG